MCHGACATVVTALVANTLAIEWLAPALRLPGWVHQLALTAHLGRVMLGIWGWVGLAISLALAVLGIALSAWASTVAISRGEFSESESALAGKLCKPLPRRR